MKLRSLFAAAIALLMASGLNAQDTVIRVGDPVEITIGGVRPEDASEINKVYSVDGDGYINLAHIGRIRANGLTPAKLAASIQSAYKSADIFTNPTISIMQQAATRFVTVGGEVKSPQRVSWSSDLGLTSAIQAAGGFTDFANRKKVIWISGGKRAVVDTTIIMSDPGQEVKMNPGDQIQVQSSPF